MNEYYQIIDCICGLILYTEMHYRFWWKGSRYFRRQPEILADIPHRVDPQEKIPLLILVKDADRFPVHLDQIQVTLSQEGKQDETRNISVDEDIHEHWWHRNLQLERSNYQGEIHINIEFQYRINGRSFTCVNHNLKLLKSRPLRVYLADEKLPGDNSVQWGDLHYHSNYTEDMVEFGAPLAATLDACNALGLNFVCITDHSYDLDDKYGSWKESDPELLRWKASRDEIIRLNQQTQASPFLVPGEELSLHNHRGRNIHALILNNKNFIPGQGDGAEKPLDFSCEFNTDSVYDELEENAVCIAAHPFIPVPFFEWLLVKRGKWEDDDIINDRLSGYQILNGALDAGFYTGRKIWIQHLLKGNKKYIYAGNDAHGNFNLFRQIATPMLSLVEKEEQILGECRTGVFPETPGDLASTLSALKSGNCMITNGPFLNMKLVTSDAEIQLGGTLILDNDPIKDAELIVNCLSSREFGVLQNLKVFQGITGATAETLFFQKDFTDEGLYHFREELDLTNAGDCYLRAELETISWGGKRLAMTNPIWIKKQA